MNRQGIQRFFGGTFVEVALAGNPVRRLYAAALIGIVLSVIDYLIDFLIFSHHTIQFLVFALLIMFIMGAVLALAHQGRTTSAHFIFLLGCWGIVALAGLTVGTVSTWFTPSTILLFVTLGLYIAARAHQPTMPKYQLPANERKEGEARYRIISELISDYAFAYAVNEDGTITPDWMTDDSFTRLTGYLWSEIGVTFKLYHPNDAARAAADVQQTIKGEATTSEYRIITRMGQTRWIYMRRRPEWSADGQRVIRFYGAAQDITDKRETEQALRLSESRYRALTANLPDSVIILFDQDMRFVLVDGPEVERAGNSRTNMEGKTIYEALEPDFIQLVEPNMRAVFNGQSFSSEVPFGDQMYIYNYLPLRNEQGEVNLGMIMGQNITLRTQAQTALQASEENARRFQGYLKALHEISLELSNAETFDDLCRSAVELGRSKLDFDRMSLWFLDKDPAYKVGSYGTDENGQTRDERQERTLFDLTFEPPRDSPLNVETQMLFIEDGLLYNEHGETVGRGWNAIVFLQNMGQMIGYISADNLLQQQRITPEKLELLKLFANTVGHLCTRKRAEDALRQSEERLQAIVSNLPIILFNLSHDGIFTFVEGQGPSLLNRETYDMLGQSSLELFRDDPPMIDAIQKAIRGESTRVTYDKDDLALEFLYTPFKDATAQTTSVIGVAVDITERKRATDRERAVLLGLRSVVEAADELLGIKEIDTFYGRAVELAREKLGLERAGIYLLDAAKQYFVGTFGTNEFGQTTDERLHRFSAADHPEFFNLGDRTWLNRDKTLTYWDNGTLYTVGIGWEVATTIRLGQEPIGLFFNDAAMTHRPLDPIQQELVAVYCSLLGSIIERKQAEEALRKAEAANRTFSERLKAMFTVTLELSKIDVLDDLCRRAIELGQSQLKFERLGLWLVAPDGQGMVGAFGIDENGQLRDERHQRAAIDPATYALSEISKDGARVDLHEDTDLYNDHSEIVGHGWIGMGTLLDGERPIGTLSVDNLLTGQPLEPYQLELLALYTSKLSNLITRQQTEIALRESEEKFRTIFDLAPYSITIQHQGGPFIDANQAFLDSFGYSLAEVQGKTTFDLGFIRDKELIQQLMNKLAVTGQMLNEEVTTYHVAGHSMTTLISGQYMQFAGKIHVLTIGVDITARIQAEQEIRQLNADLEERVEQRTQQLQATNKELEAFAYSVSHDLRAPLRTIDGFGQALLEDYEALLDETGKGYLRRTRAAAQRMGTMIDTLLTLSRITRTELNLQWVNLSSIAAEIVTMLQEDQPERAVNVYIEPRVYGRCDARLLQIALENLLQNAWKYTNQQPRARIEFGSRELNGETVYFVADNGVGFDMTYANKLFVAFQRLHTEQEFPGTGIGLATVQRVIHRHGGKIWAEAQLSQGATFYFTLLSGNN